MLRWGGGDLAEANRMVDHLCFFFSLFAVLYCSFSFLFFLLFFFGFSFRQGFGQKLPF